MMCINGRRQSKRS